MGQSREDGRRERALCPCRETPERGEARLYQRRLRDREHAFFVITRCLAVISMGNLASERTLVYWLAFAALFDT